MAQRAELGNRSRNQRRTMLSRGGTYRLFPVISPGSYSRLPPVSRRSSRAVSFSLVALVVSALAACSGTEEECNSIECAQNQPPANGAGGSGGAGPTSPGLVGSGAGPGAPPPTG